MFALLIFEGLYSVRCNRKSNIRFLIDYYLKKNETIIWVTTDKQYKR